MPRRLNDNRQIIVIASNLRSTHNVGSLFRTAEGLGVKELILSGYSPYPKSPKDDRLGYIADKLDRQIAKTALGAEKTLSWRHVDELESEIAKLRGRSFVIYGLEQAKNSVGITDLSAPSKLVLILGNEVTGMEPETMELCDELLEIPMFGQKESFNVVQAAAMALFYLRFF
jgi:tRNA G18 (ribose-2'-O)-methylase SpoU